MVDYIDRCSDIKPTLNFCVKLHLVKIYYLFIYSWIRFAYILRIFASIFMIDIVLWFSFLLMPFSGMTLRIHFQQGSGNFASQKA